MANQKKDIIKNQIHQILVNKEKMLSEIYTKSLEQLVEDLKIYQYELEFQNDELLRIQQELERSQQEFHDLFHDAPLGYLIIDDQHHIIQSNSNANQYFGFNIVGEKQVDFRKFIKPEYQDAYHVFYQRLQKCHKSNEMELELITHQQQPLHVCLTAHMKIKEERYLCYLAINDISRRKMAEQQVRIKQQEMMAITESMTEMIVVSNPQYLIQYVSPSCRMLGFTPAYFEGKDIFALIHANDASRVKNAFYIAIQKGITDIIRFRSLTSTGDYLWVETSGNYIRNEQNEIEKIVFVVRDISLVIEKEMLEKEIEIKKNTLDFKQKFLASLSHEIRTPLTGVIGMVELLEKTSLDRSQTDFVSTIKNSSESLREIIDQVLDYSKIEAGKVKLNKKPFAIKDIVDDATKLFQSICNKPVEWRTFIEPGLPRLIIADKNRIMQVINNLVGNAVKFTAQGTLELHISCHENTDDETLLLKIDILDTGLGINKSLHSHIFTPFSQIEQIDSEKYYGIGLGLTICKELVELHGGEINLESEPGKGSRFWFTFRAERVNGKLQTMYDDTNTAKEEAKEGLNILLVEDKAVTQKVVRLQLEGMGHKVTIAVNGKEALEIYKPNLFDLVLMDIQMPVMDGITATHILRENFGQLPPVVGLSANAFEGDREKYINKGLDDYLTKPVRAIDFLNLIKKLSLKAGK